MNKIREILIEFIPTLNHYDYIGFFLTTLLFLFFLLLALIIRKRTKLSLFFVFCSFSIFFIGPVAVNFLLKDTLFKHKSKITNIKQLSYSKTLIINGQLIYKGKINASYCMAYATVYKKSKNLFKKFYYTLRAFRSKSKKIDKILLRGDKIDFRIILEPFNYKGNYNITLTTRCYK